MIRGAHTDEDRLLSREWAAPLPGLAARHAARTHRPWKELKLIFIRCIIFDSMKRTRSNCHPVNFPSKWVYYCHVSYQLHITTTNVNANMNSVDVLGNRYSASYNSMRYFLRVTPFETTIKSPVTHELDSY